MHDPVQRSFQKKMILQGESKDKNRLFSHISKDHSVIETEWFCRLYIDNKAPDIKQNNESTENLTKCFCL